MSIRRLFIGVLVTFTVAFTAAVGYLAWKEASQALEEELDTGLTRMAGAAAETGLTSSLLVGLEPGFEDELAWTSTHSKLQRLLRYVRAAYIFRQDNTAVVTSYPADSIPIGAALPFLALYPDELKEAWRVGNATTPVFRGADGAFYKYGFAKLEQSSLMLAVLMPADYFSPLAKLRREIIYGSVLATVFAALLAGLLAAGIIQPLERLSRVALRIQRGQVGLPVAEERGLELGRLSRAMERMRLGIIERDEQLRLMLAQVAHEIRNPLGGLELFASAAADTDDAEERRRLIDRVRNEVGALNGIIDDFLTFARPMGPQRAATDLRRPAEEAAELACAEVERRGGVLTVEMAPEPLMAHADPDHVKRAVLNLLRNAAQAAKHVRIRGWLARGEVVLAVSDDGPGVPPEFRERIFDPFVTDKEQGAGLGLAIVRKVAEAHGGRAELVVPDEHSGGRGAEFRVYFPSMEDPPSGEPGFGE